MCICGVSLPGCMVGPEYKRPATLAETPGGYYLAGENNQDPNALTQTDEWWYRFGDPLTPRLVIEALNNNYDIKAAAARVLEAQAVLAENRGRLWPAVSYNLSRSRNKVSFNFGGGRFNALTTNYSQGLSISYVLDLWGKLRHAERAAWQDLLAAGANRQALTNSLIASVIKARTDIATLQCRLAIAEATTESRRRTLQIVERRYNEGLVGPVDVRLARENLASAQVTEPAIELSLITAMHALDVLLARPPGSSGPLPQGLAELPDLRPVPVGLPASLLDRRPDIRAAEFSLRAANQRLGVSIAQLFPDLTLTGNVGRSADTWNDIWKRNTEVYSGIINLAQPIFQGGRLLAQVDAAKARYQQFAAAYAGVVLMALREVEDALAAEQLLQTQLQHAHARLTEADAAEHLSKQRYSRGVETVLTVLESERRRYAAEEQLAVLKGRLWTARVNLHLALGGNWAGHGEAEKNRPLAKAEKK